MSIIEASPAVDLSILAFENAVSALGAFPNDVVLWCSESCGCIAYKIQEEYDCAVVLVPSILMKNLFVWAVTTLDSMYWSPVTA
jgi:hypothetical protein